ncbi:MAG: tetratricopeptide repeat protein [Candidatus Midichloria sp.]
MYNDLASLYYDQDNYDNALALFKKSLGIRLSIYGEDSQEVAIS